MTEIWTGTADVENGEALVTVASGDPLSDANCSAGSIVVLDGVVYFVAGRVNTLSFNLTRPYAGTDASGVTLDISPVSAATTNLTNLAAVVARTQAQLNILDKNSQGLFFNLLGTTGAADPGPGNIAFNNADPTTVTAIYADVLDANEPNRDVAGLLDLWTAGTVVLIRSLASSAYVSYQLPTGVTVQSGWRSAEARYVGHDGVIADGEALTVSWFRVGEGLKIDFVGSFAYRATFNGEAAGFMYLSTNGNGSTNLTPSLYRKNTADAAGWSTQVPFQGASGDRGWSPRFALAADGTRRVLRLVGYVGGEGPAPTAGIGQYVSAGGLDPNIANGEDVRGAAGAPGLDGADGTDPGIFFNWDDATAEANPGAGNVRANAADLLLATEYYVSKTNRGGNNVAARLLAMGGSTNTIKGGLTFTRSGGNAQVAADVVSVADAAGYVKITVINAAGATGFIDGDPVSLQFERAGDQGSADLASVAGAVNGADAKAALVADDVVLITDSEDSAAGKKVTAAGAGRFFGTRSVDVCAAIAGSKGMAARLFVPGGMADGFCNSDGIAGTSTNYTLDAVTGRVMPTAGSVVQIAQGTGVAIGNLTANGGLAAAFDGVTSQSYAACARSVNTTDTSGWIGKNYSGGAKRLDHVTFWGSNDVGLNGANGGASTVTLRLRAKNGSAPASRTDGTLLATYGPVVDPNGHTATMVSSDKATAWDYVWLDYETNGVGCYMAEVQFFEIAPIQNMTVVTTTMPTDESAEAVVVSLIVRPLESITLNTDLTVEVSRDDGATFATGTLVQLHAIGADRYCETEAISVAGQGAGSGLIVRIKTANYRSLEIRGLFMEAR